ncbi:GPR endopeptidase [Amphibacillus xylanus]|uniref:Germination protease n=1 Tax=Amphibacillus xylanus (strain ATCC 51415 / DSM 6626 / JCM 7361 / LMG 17667 / NBRC 15112 / Ep01) TaxID=698758 RepID=K0IXM1_AMPXN|nr:GPR endopeptidase [Amphibacillus xylanus]BAM47225.1 germination protease [Amphibacillus xylanus NBRC 15112]
MNEDKYFQIRTDLAVEAREMYVEEEKQTEDIEGVLLKEQKIKGFQVTDVRVDKTGEKKIDKKAGRYITLETDAIKNGDSNQQQATAEVLSVLLADLLKENNINESAQCLVVGLGNDYVTPDALGPQTVKKILVTKHLFTYHPEMVAEGYRPVSAFSPGVMGVTGMETSDIIQGIVKELNPDFIIAIDALASRSIDRVNSTIQVSDTGIHPGSGVNNKRKALSYENFGIPVISIGVPTVVDAVTITSDTIDYVFKHFGREFKEKDRPSKRLAPASLTFGKKTLTESDMPSQTEKANLFGMIGKLDETEKRQLIKEVLSPLGYNLMVTPKEVDSYIHDLAHLIATGINGALHENVNSELANSFTR